MKHSMVIETDTYEKTYGYASQSRLVCSCGEVTKWQAGTGGGMVASHRDRVIEAALGLEFENAGRERVNR